MKGSHYFIIFMAILCLTSCEDESTSPLLDEISNFPVTTNVANSLAYTIVADHYSGNSQNNLNFQSDSLVVTLLCSDYSSGQAIFTVKDSLNAIVFSDTVKSNKTNAITNLKAKNPRLCNISITNLTAKLVFTLVGQ